MELDEVAQAGAAYGEVTGVLAAESVTGERSYLVALGDGEAREWLLLDTAAQPVSERTRVREVASLVAMCEVAAELAVAPRPPPRRPSAHPLGRGRPAPGP